MLVISIEVASSPTYVPLMNRISSPTSILPVLSAGSPGFKKVILFPMYLRPKVPLGPLDMVTVYRDAGKSKRNEIELDDE